MKEQNFTKAYDHVMCDKSQSYLARLIYCRLARFTENGNDAYPSQDWLVEEFGSNRRQVQIELDRLMEAGLISKRQRGLNKTNIYHTHEWPKQPHYAMLEARKKREAMRKQFPDVQDPACPDVQDSTLQERQDSAHIRDKINIQSLTDKLLKEDELLSEEDKRKIRLEEYYKKIGIRK